MITVLTPPLTNDLTTITTAQRELRLTQDDLDGVPELITAASTMCAQWCNRLGPDGVSEFGEQTVRQTVRGAYGECIVLDRDINPAIVTVVEDGATLTADDYELDGSLLYRLSGDERRCWSAAKVTITYTTGWTLVSGLPHPLEVACLKTIAALVAGRGENPMERRFDNGLVSVSYGQPDGGVPQDAAQLLQPWLRLSL